MKFATRYMLPLEFCLSLVALLVGAAGSGLLGNAPVAASVAQGGSQFWWGMLLISLGGIMLAVTSHELLRGRYWPSCKLLVSVSARCTIAFFAVPIWLYAIVTLLANAQAHTAIIPTGLSAISFVLNLWVYWVNLRVRYLLNPEVSTLGLQRRMGADRMRAQ